ncbi:hypothetical protein PBI_SCTP2_43 [Salicola phage SCTP-2]|nr:hypothetical protein PBI_SCTP2_43 [Salicola phage SCTP-2]
MKLGHYFVKKYEYYYNDTVCYETKFLWFPTVVGDFFKDGIELRWLGWGRIYWLWNVTYGWHKIRFTEDEQ